MATEAVKRQILLAVDALTIPQSRVPSASSIGGACAAAKLLRNRLLREHTRVTERIEALRERQMYDEVSDDDVNYDDDDAEVRLAGGDVSRSEFVFLCEMMVAEKLVIPLLLAHGMNFGDTLLPQLLKLLAVMLLPVPRYSANEVSQKDLLQKIKTRCGTDEFFALLVQCVAPIAEKRTSGDLQRDDVVILEIILTLIAHLLDGSPPETERIIGAFCRNHGVELLLVVINQNYSRVQSANAAQLAAAPGHDTESHADIAQNDTQADANGASTALPEVEINLESADEESEINLEDDDDNSLSAPEVPNAMTAALDREFQQQVHSLLESDDQLWKWNCLALASISSVIWCVPAEELAQLTLLGHTSDVTPERLLSALRNSQQFRDCKKASDRWRFVARSRNGAVTSNGILVRGSADGTTGGNAIGTAYSLLGPHRKDPLEAVRDADLRKRGHFVKGMFQGATAQCNLPLPTKIQLSQQNSSFLCFGFEPLSSMTFAKLQQITTDVERATREHKEVIAGYKGSGETIEMTSPLDTATYQNLRCVLHYMTICRCTLRFVRILAEQLKTDQQSFLVMFPQHWQSVSAIVSLDYLELGFSVLRAFLDCKDIRRREDITNVVGYLAEILLLLNMLLQGDISTEPAVEVAAHALASSVLYKEDNIKVVFGLLSEYSSRVIAVRKAQVFTLFTFAVFQLMEKCSYKGNLLLPKRPRPQKESAVVDSGEAADVGGVADVDDNESINSATLENAQEEMLRDMADMIDDSDSDAGVKAEEGVAQRKEEPDGAELLETSFQPVLGDASVESDDAAVSERAASEGRPPSIASSGRTALSTLSSEREVAVGGFFQRLASPKNISLVYSALRHWRINDVDVNIALTFLMDSLVRNNCESVFMNVGFLLVMREVLTSGETTHAPLYAVCDRIVYNFFNPPLAKAQDARAAAKFTSESERGLLSGAQSYLGFEVALRCARALFNFSTMDYTYLEEKGMAHLMSYTAIPLPSEKADAGVDEYDEALAAVSAASDSPAGKPQRHRRSAAAASPAASPEEDKDSAPDSEAGDDREPPSRGESPAAEESGKEKPKRAKRHREHRDGEKKKKRHKRKDAESAVADTDIAGGMQQVEPAWSSASVDDAADSAAAAMALAVATAAPFPASMEETLVVEDTQ